ncbi:MAG: carboxymuconolactone decarboxylase family protein [Kofleriaceae bacterium]|nr:carboxymuconolactone decarboxylase family protein [Myxococcales bacterium]MCB9562963.1 carboxymuconolactone decarboxylase family protein [Kofleriaceae bacterium]
MGEASQRGDVFAEIEQAFGLVPEWLKLLPEEALAGSWTLLRDFYFGETSLPGKYKELIGIAVAGATRCRYCQLFHTEAARLQGATDAEIAEAAEMGGVTMMASTFINGMALDLDDFRDETRKVIAYVRRQRAARAARPEGGDHVRH